MLQTVSSTGLPTNGTFHFLKNNPPLGSPSVSRKEFSVFQIQNTLTIATGG